MCAKIVPGNTLLWCHRGHTQPGIVPPSETALILSPWKMWTKHQLQTASSIATIKQDCQYFPSKWHLKQIKPSFCFSDADDCLCISANLLPKLPMKSFYEVSTLRLLLGNMYFENVFFSVYEKWLAYFMRLLVGHKHTLTTRWQCWSVQRCSKCSGALSSFEVLLFFLVGKRGKTVKQRKHTHTHTASAVWCHTYLWFFLGSLLLRKRTVL